MSSRNLEPALLFNSVPAKADLSVLFSVRQMIASLVRPFPEYEISSFNADGVTFDVTLMTGFGSAPPPNFHLPTTTGDMVQKLPSASNSMNIGLLQTLGTVLAHCDCLSALLGKMFIGARSTRLLRRRERDIKTKFPE